VHRPAGRHPHPGGDGGDYDLFIAGLRRVGRLCPRAGAAASSGKQLILTGLTARANSGWKDARPSTDMRYFGCGPEDSLKAYERRGARQSQALSGHGHAFTWAHHIADHDKRIEAVLTYFQRPGAIAHVHWNGHEAFEPDGRVDGHLNVGKTRSRRRYTECQGPGSAGDT